VYRNRTYISGPHCPVSLPLDEHSKLLY